MKRKIYDIFVKFGKILFVVNVLVVISIVIHSFTMNGKVNYGGRCNIENKLDSINEFEYTSVDLKISEIKCNTYYLTYYSKLDKNNNILFLNSLSKFLYENDVKDDVQVTILGEKTQMIASIIDYKIHYIESIRN